MAEARRSSGMEDPAIHPAPGTGESVADHRHRGLALSIPRQTCFWPYSDLAVVTHSGADNEVVAGTIRRPRRPPMTRGLNRKHNRVREDVFTGAATAAAHKDGPQKDSYKQSLARGVDEAMALLTLARKISSVALRQWKKGERWDPTKLNTQAT